MPRVKEYHTRSLYFPQKLTDRLHTLCQYPCTVVEAPIGYGKTTAVREAVRVCGVRALWQRVYDDSVTDFWLGFCQAFGELDPSLAPTLRQLGLPNNSVLLREVAQLLHALPLPGETLLIIDDYHLVKASAADDFLQFLIQRLPPRLHIVIITRVPFLKSHTELQIKGFINHIGARMLEFDPDDITGYYKMCGVQIEPGERDQLYRYSEGWVSALYLLLLEYIEQGCVSSAVEVPELVRHAVYLPLDEELKSFLLHISLLDSFSLRQAEHMWQRGDGRALLDRLQSLNAFLVQDRTGDRYHLHRLFGACVREEFERQPMAFRMEQWRRAGQWHHENGEYMAAIRFFWQAGDFDCLLESVGADHINALNDDHKALLKDVVESCPEQVRSRHPFAMLVYLRRLFMLNEIQRFFQTSGAVLRYIGSVADGGFRELLLGEYELVMSFSKYNDILGMSRHHQAAHRLLKASSVLLDAKLDWTFASPSVLLMFYRESGKLTEHIEIMARAMPDYNQVTGGHGTGAEDVMRAEAHYLRGQWEDAQICAHGALARAREREQWSIVLCATFLLARVAQAQGDDPQSEAHMQRLRQELSAHHRYQLFHTLEACESYLHALQGRMGSIAPWLLDGEYAAIKWSLPAVPAIQWMYGRVLLEQGDDARLIGQTPQFLQTAGIFPNLLSAIYAHIHCAAAQDRLNRRREAVEQLRQALDLAVADGLCMPFAENWVYLQGLLPAIGSIYDALLSPCGGLCAAFPCARAQTEKTAEALLTAREQEIATLAAQGLTNKQIGEQLYISENTVKARLKSIFEKLSIKSRAQLDITP